MSVEGIKHFVQKILGCGCPENVFSHIECHKDVQMDGIKLRSKINIGNRLLIYIIDINNSEYLSDILQVLIKEGRKERDTGFNRFRLVLSTKIVEEIKSKAESLFMEIDKDDKVHLHVVPSEDIPPC